MKLLVLLIAGFATFSLMASELTINSFAVNDNPIIKKNDQWSFIYQREFKDRDVNYPEMQLSQSGWKKHPKYAHITGYNGDITLKIVAPGPIAQLDAESVITNYADAKIRASTIAWSLDGVNYTEIVNKEFGTGAVIAHAKVELLQNKGIIWLRFSRKVAVDDLNGRNGFVLFSKIKFELKGAFDLSRKNIKSTIAENKSASLMDFYPTGCFWPWERTKPNADFAKMELWAFVEQTMKLLKESNCNTLWFVNIDNSDTCRKILLLAEKYQLKVFLNTDLLGLFYNGISSFADVEQRARKTINNIGDCPALAGYVLKDEPLLCSIEQCSYFYRLMKKMDPLHRDSVAVVMNRQSQSYIENSDLPVVCTDIYYFGHDKSTNIPNPASVSQKEFRICVGGLNLVAEKYGKRSWLMPQMYSEIWGRHFRVGDKMMVEPGSYLHWRMPTDAETRWQIWEGTRLGSTGMIFFVLLPPIPLFENPERIKAGTYEAKRVAQMDASAKKAAAWGRQELTQTQVEVDPWEAMLQPGGKSTPQMLAVSEAFRKLRKFSDLILTKKSAKFPVLFASDDSTGVATFELPDQETKRIGIVVNQDLQQSRQIKLLLPMNMKSLINLDTSESIKITAENENFQSCFLKLDAGDGCILEAEFTNDQPGMLLCREDFSQLDQHKVTLNQNNAKIVRWGSFGVTPFYGVILNGQSTEPVFTIKNLTNSKSAVNTFFMNLNCRKSQGIVYCLVKGELGSCQIKALSDSKSGINETNVSHLNEVNIADGKIAKSNAAQVIKQNSFQIPAVIPVGTTGLEFYLSNPADRIDNFAIWFIPNN